MANIRVKDLPNADTLADVDEMIIDSSSSGTRRIAYSELKTEVAADYVAAPSTYKLATLGSDNRLTTDQIPDSISQGLNFVGNANSAGDLTSTTQGDFYVIQTAFDSYAVGDQAVYNGSAYVKVTSGTKQIAEGGTGATSLSQAQTNLEIGNIGTGANDIPLNSFLNSGAYLDFDAFYQTGTWVPDLTFSGLKTGVSYTTQSGNYVKVGKSVTIHCHIVLNSAGSDSGNLRIDGLPFTSITGQYSSGSVGYVTGMGAGGLTVTPTFFVNANSKEINFYKFGGSTVAKADVADNMNIRFSATYQIA